jgi:Fibronectin type III domain
VKRLCLFWILAVVAISISACGGGGGGDAAGGGGSRNSGPWNGDWIQVNFLSLDDNGVWSSDDPSGIGFVAEITETGWVETDDFGNGCSVTYSYSVDSNNKFSKKATSKGDNCPTLSLELYDETGRLEFSGDNNYMIEYFDLVPGDDIVAFKWKRQPSGTVPSAPTGITATPGDGQVTISWNAVSGATSYNLYMASQSGLTKNNYSTLTDGMAHLGVTSPFIHTGLTNGTTYYFVVTAVNTYGESSESGQVSATPSATMSAPSAPTGVTATAGNGKITIGWNTVSGATSYNTFWNTTADVTTSDNKIGSVTSPYVHTGRTNGTTYHYIVTAVNGIGESAPSGEVSATPSDSLSSTVIDTLPADSSLATTGALAQGGTFVAVNANLAEFTINVTMGVESAARPIVLGTTGDGTPTLGPVLWEGPDVITPFFGEITFQPNVALTVGQRYFIGLDYGFLTSVVGDVILLGGRTDDPIPDGQAWRAFSDGWDPFSPGIDIAARIVMNSEPMVPNAP